MATRRGSLALAALVVVARLVSSGATATAATATEETIRAELAQHNVPSRSLRSAHGAHARVVARISSLGACLAALPIAVEEPARTIVPPTVIPAAAPVTALIPPRSLARAPPR